MIFPGSQGATLPRNLQAHMKFLQQFTLFWREFDFKVYQYFLSNEGILPITHNMQEIFSCHRKKFLVSGRNFLALEEISCHRKKLFVKGIYKYLVRETNFLSQEEISCQKQKNPITRRNSLPLDEIYCQRKELFLQITAILNAPVASDSRCFGRNFRLKVLVPTK